MLRQNLNRQYPCSSTFAIKKKGSLCLRFEILKAAKMSVVVIWVLSVVGKTYELRKFLCFFKTCEVE
jgi:hypothetical protein